MQCQRDDVVVKLDKKQTVNDKLSFLSFFSWRFSKMTVLSLKVFNKNELAGVYNASGNFAHKNAKLPKSAQGLARSISQSMYKRTGKFVKFK